MDRTGLLPHRGLKEGNLCSGRDRDVTDCDRGTEADGHPQVLPLLIPTAAVTVVTVAAGISCQRGGISIPTYFFSSFPFKERRTTVTTVTGGPASSAERG